MAPIKSADFQTILEYEIHIDRDSMAPIKSADFQTILKRGSY